MPSARSAVPVALALACLAPCVPAQAAPLPPALLSGLLSVTVLPPALTSLTTTGSTSTGSLGTTTIVDGRLAATGYDVSVSTTGFDLVGASSQTAASHIPTASVSARVTGVTGGTASNTSSTTLNAAPLFRMAYASGISLLNLTTTYTLSLTVVVPAAAASGQYTGIVTQTVA